MLSIASSSVPTWEPVYFLPETVNQMNFGKRLGFRIGQLADGFFSFSKEAIQVLGNKPDWKFKVEPTKEYNFTKMMKVMALVASIFFSIVSSPLFLAIPTIGLAIKVLYKTKLNCQDDLWLAYQKFKIQSQLNAKNVLRILDFALEKNDLFLKELCIRYIFKLSPENKLTLKQLPSDLPATREKAVSDIVEAIENKENLPLKMILSKGQLSLLLTEEMKDEHFEKVLGVIDSLSVKTITFSKSESFSESAVKYVAKILQTNKTITEVNLSHRELYDEDISTLTEALKTNSTVKILNLSNDTIGDKGAEILVALIKSKPSLQYVDLTKNAFTEIGKALLEDTQNQNPICKLVF